MRAWFDSLAPRERLLVLTAAGLAVLAIIVTLGIRPLFSQTDRARQRVSDQRALLIELDRLAQRIGPQTGTARPAASGTGDSLVVLVDRTSRERGLGPYLKRNQPEGSGGIRLRLENAPFDTVVEWLADLQAAHGLTAVSAAFDPADEPGRTDCTLMLARSGA